MQPACLLLHETKTGSHLDLLLSGPRCPTWSFFQSKRVLHIARASLFFHCQNNKPHRRFYLDYSGPVPGNRGRVNCVWRGRMRYIAGSADTLTQTWLADEFQIYCAANGLARLVHGDRLSPWLKSIFQDMKTRRLPRS